MELISLIKNLFIPYFLISLLVGFTFKRCALLFVHCLFTWSWVSLIAIGEDWSAISVYLRIFLMVSCLIGIIFSIKNSREMSCKNNKTRTFWFIILLYGLFTLIFFFFCAIYSFTILVVPNKIREASISIGFPLNEGFYAVAHGGLHSSINYHYDYPTQRYAFDIVKLNVFGLRKSLFQKELSLGDYEIYGDTVYSPVDGEIVAVVDNIEESFKRVITTPMSNMIVIGYKDYYILLLHLKPGSIRVKKGEQVAFLQPIGKVGNSGNSSEPHLHVHAIRRMQGMPTDYFKAESIPIMIHGHFLKRNDVLYNQKLILR